ncbi:MAG TPA: hypothetical protein VGF58_13115 [Burkholderiales bacterium]|jgi:hypothetical protein
MASVSGWDIPIGLTLMGALFLAVAWIAVAEYWRAFRADPQAVMSLEVLANILKLGGPGYLAMLALVVGLPMFLGGASALLFFVGFSIFESGRELFRAIGLTLGLS